VDEDRAGESINQPTGQIGTVQLAATLHVQRIELIGQRRIRLRFFAADETGRAISTLPLTRPASSGCWRIAPPVRPSGWLCAGMGGNCCAMAGAVASSAISIGIERYRMIAIPR
jgi:hypothetical protein